MCIKMNMCTRFLLNAHEMRCTERRYIAAHFYTLFLINRWLLCLWWMSLFSVSFALEQSFFFLDFIFFRLPSASAFVTYYDIAAPSVVNITGSLLHFLQFFVALCYLFTSQAYYHQPASFILSPSQIIAYKYELSCLFATAL